MHKPQLELADVIGRFIGPYQQQFGDRMLPSHHRALQDIIACMTEAMGGQRYQCHDCHEDFWIYHGCRNRSCPKCHGQQIADWLKSRTAEILPCPYYHVKRRSCNTWLGTSSGSPSPLADWSRWINPT